MHMSTSGSTDWRAPWYTDGTTVHIPTGYPSNGNYGEVPIETSLLFDAIEMLNALTVNIDAHDVESSDDPGLETIRRYRLRAAARRITSQLEDSAAVYMEATDRAQCRDWLADGPTPVVPESRQDTPPATA